MWRCPDDRIVQVAGAAKGAKKLEGLEIDRLPMPLRFGVPSG